MAKKKPFFSCLGCSIAGGGLLILVAILLPHQIRPRHAERLATCRHNLKNIAMAAEIYASDSKGRYPSKLAQLVSFNDLDKIPTCPEPGSVAYRYEVVNGKAARFTICCAGNNHATAYHDTSSAAADYPQFRSEEGLVDWRPR